MAHHRFGKCVMIKILKVGSGTSNHSGKHDQEQSKHEFRHLVGDFKLGCGRRDEFGSGNVRFED